jgi:hypothetical protein
MKLYKLRFTQEDFVSKDSNVWRTDVIDLYDNDQYKNYSVRRAPYGTDLLGNGVYTGLNSPDGVNSEIGYVYNNRFIDTSGPIDVLTWNVSMSQAAQAPVDTKLNVYSTLDQGLTPYYAHATPSMVNDWASVRDLDPGSTIYKFNAERYCFFELDFVSDASINTDAEIELIVSVEIYPPVVNGFFPGTRRILNKFPEWMEMREYDPQDLNDDNKATPTKFGSLFLNSVSGEWLTDLRGKISYEEFQRYIENVDIGQKAWVYRSSAIPKHVFSVHFNEGGGNIQLAYTSSIGEFYECANDDDAFFYNEGTSEIYTLKEYDSLEINGEEFDQELYQVWNSIDDLGVAVDLFRIRGENNDSFRKRILDVYINKPGVTAERFKTALRRELNLWKYEGATPDSKYLGATPEIITIEDIEQSDLYFTPDGLPKESFYNLVEKLAKKYPMTWGLFRYGEALWDSDGLYHKGMATIPKQLDAATPNLNQYQSGVGDGNDLFVLRPDFYKDEQDFDLTLAVRGKRPVPTARPTEIRFDAHVTGISSYTTAEYDTVTSPFYIEIVANGISYIANITLSAAFYGGDPGLINLDTYSVGGTWPPPNLPESISRFEWYSPDGTTASFLQWYRKSDGGPVGGTISTADITKVDIYPSFWNPQTQTASGSINQNYYNLKFSDASLTGKLGHAGTVPLSDLTPDFSTEDLSLEFQAYDFTVTVNNAEGFVSVPQSIEVVVNKDNILGPCTITVGNFNFPDYNDAGAATHKIKVEILEQDEDNNYGVFVNSDSELFIPANGNLSLNGSSVWSSGSRTITLGSPLAVGGTVDLTFACSSAPGYPETVPSWQPLYVTQVSPLINQKINEHGPYRYGLPPRVNNSSFVLETLSLHRDDFGLLEDDVVTWIGVDSVSNDNVLAWLDTSSIVPFGEDKTLYPNGALVETETGSLGKLPIYTKLRPNVNPKWDPFVHAGWFYEDQKDYYLFAQPESATLDSGASLVLNSQPQQGAPIIAETDSGYQLRQIPKFNSSTPLYFSETKPGTGTDSLFVGYGDIVDIFVYNNTLAESVSLVSDSSVSNEVKTVLDTNKSHTYTITYKPSGSFYADNLSTPGQTELLFSEPATPSTTSLLKEAVLWLDAANGAAGEQSARNLGTGGTALNARYGSGTGADTNDPLLLTHTGENYVYLPGVLGLSNRPTVPAASVPLTGDLDVRVKLDPGDWASPVFDSSGVMVAQVTADPERRFAFRLNSGGQIMVQLYPDGTSANSALRVFSGTLPFANNTPGWLRMTVDTDNGAGQHEAKVFTSTDGVSWNQYGTTQAAAPAYSLVASGSPISIGGWGAGNQSLAAKFYAVQIKDGIDGPTVFDFNAATDITSAAATSFTATSGQTVTVNRATSGRKTALVTRPIWLFGTDDYLEVPDNDLIDFGAADSFTVMAVVRQWATPVSSGRYINKRAASGAGYQLQANTTTHAAAFVVEDGAAASVQGISPTSTGGALRSLIGVRNTVADTLTTYLNSTAGTPVTDTTTGSLANSSVLRMGSRSDSVTTVQDMELVAVAIWRRALTAAEIAVLVDYYQYDYDHGRLYDITWESSQFNPSRQIELPLHTVYNSMGEGFIYLDHDEQDLSYVEAQVSPSHILATPGDYAMVTLHAYDRFGNPKPNVTFELNHHASVELSDESVTTDSVGSAIFYIEAKVNSVSGAVSATPQGYVVDPVDISYHVRKISDSKNKVVGVMDSNQVIADGTHGTALFGYVFDYQDNPVPGVDVHWRKARDIKTLLVDTAISSSTATPGQNGVSGKVTTNANGRFTIGPFVSHDEPGYWLVSIETSDQEAGDVTYWYEYLTGTNILDPYSLQPYAYSQQATPSDFYEKYYNVPAYPVNVDERDYFAGATGATPGWNPPKWFPVPRYLQYQMGLLGSGYYDFDTSATPYYDDFVES